MGMKWEYHMIEWCRILSMNRNSCCLQCPFLIIWNILAFCLYWGSPKWYCHHLGFVSFFHIPDISFTSHIHENLWVIGLRGSNHQRHPARTLHGQPLVSSFLVIWSMRWWIHVGPQECRKLLWENFVLDAAMALGGVVFEVLFWCQFFKIFFGFCVSQLHVFGKDGCGWFLVSLDNSMLIIWWILDLLNNVEIKMIFLGLIENKDVVQHWCIEGQKRCCIWTSFLLGTSFCGVFSTGAVTLTESVSLWSSKYMIWGINQGAYFSVKVEGSQICQKQFKTYQNVTYLI